MPQPLQLKQSMSLDASVRAASRMRGGLSELVIDFFRASEESVKTNGLLWVSEREDIVKPEDLDQWLRRPSGVLVVGSHKSLLSRLINGEDIKNQATGTIRTATGNLIYLNLAQLMRLRVRTMAIDLSRSAIPELRDYASCLEEALCEKFCSALLDRSSVMYVKDEKSGLERESLTNVERKFIGKRLFLHLGILNLPENATHTYQFELQNSVWYISCGTKIPKTPEDCRGVFFQYPSLDIKFERPEGVSILCFAENKDAGKVASKVQCTYHVMEVKVGTGIDELVRASLTFKSGTTTTTAPRGTARTRHVATDQLPPKKAVAVAAPPVPPVDTKSEVKPDSTRTTTAPETPSTPGPSESIETPTEVPTSVKADSAPEEPGAPAEVAAPEVVATEEGEELVDEEAGEETGDVDEDAAGEYYEWDEEWAQGPVEYDEAVPTYYDYQMETYFYYGNILYYDPDWSSYYYYDWEQGTYMYVDEETQQAINDGTIPIWNSEDQQYYDPSQWVTEGEATPEGEMEPTALDETELAQTTEEPEVMQTVDEPGAAATQPETESIPAVLEPVKEPEDPVTPAPKTELQFAPTPPTEAESDDDSKPYTTTPTRASKTTISPPPKVPEKFSGSIDQFKSSESMLVNRAMRQLIELLEPQSHLLTQYATRPNGTLRVGRCRRLIDGLIHGTMELKSLAATDCSDVASSLAVLNLPQLVHIRSKAQNSAWDKSPQSALKTFAMKTDSLIAEKLVMYCLDQEANGEEPVEAGRNEKLIKMLSGLECRHVGSQLIFVLGAIAELKNGRDRILGEAYCGGLTPTPRSSWWFLACSPTGGVVAPRGRVEEKPKGVFFQLPQFHARFDRPESTDHVFKLVAGRQTGGFIQWDVLDITL